MRASRGMGCMSESKLKGVTKLARKDNPGTVDMYAKGGKVGLYENIHSKRARIAAGSGEKMRKPGAKGAPTASAFKAAAKTAKKRS